jgi:Zn-dependent protease with chaperone function
MTQPPQHIPADPLATVAAAPTAELPDTGRAAPDPVAQAAPRYSGEPSEGGLHFDPRTGARTDRTFSGIDARTIRDPRDAMRMANLRVIKGLDFVYNRFLNAGVEQQMRLEMLAQSIRLGLDQAPSLWKLLDRAARILDIRVPDLYLGHGDAGIVTVGYERPYILLDTGFADLLTDEELVFVFGRELGHILIGHVTYKMLARSIGAIGGLIGYFTLNFGSMAATGLEGPLRDWDQFSEFSGDRAGLLTVQRLDVALGTLLKLAGGGTRFADEMDMESFLEQGRQALWEDRPVGTRLTAILRSLQAGKPLLAARAAALVDWYNSGEYHEVMMGSYARRQ